MWIQWSATWGRPLCRAKNDHLITPRAASESNPRDTVGQEGGKKKRSPDFQLIKLSRARGLMKAPPLELARNRSRANICPLFAICTGQKFRTVATLQQIFIRRFFFSFSFSFWLLSFVARSVETSINCQKLSKFLMTVWRLITENRFVLRRASYTRRVFSFPFSVCHFQFPQLFFIYG